jgi:hypothetical protein
LVNLFSSKILITSLYFISFSVVCLLMQSALPHIEHPCQIKEV